jgi:hypothetical protein
MAWGSSKEGDRVRMGPVTEQVVESTLNAPTFHKT